jgi:hypothetical protein
VAGFNAPTDTAQTDYHPRSPDSLASAAAQIAESPRPPTLKTPSPCGGSIHLSRHSRIATVARPKEAAPRPLPRQSLSNYSPEHIGPGDAPTDCPGTRLRPGAGGMGSSDAYLWEVQRHWRKWLYRRNRLRSLNWTMYRSLLQRFPLAPVRTVHSVYRKAANP